MRKADYYMKQFEQRQERQMSKLMEYAQSLTNGGPNSVVGVRTGYLNNSLQLTKVNSRTYRIEWTAPYAKYTLSKTKTPVFGIGGKLSEFIRRNPL